MTIELFLNKWKKLEFPLAHEIQDTSKLSFMKLKHANET